MRHGQRYRFTDQPLSLVTRQSPTSTSVGIVTAPCRRTGRAGVFFDKAMSTAQKLATWNARNAEFWKEKP